MRLRSNALGGSVVVVPNEQSVALIATIATAGVGLFYKRRSRHINGGNINECDRVYVISDFADQWVNNSVFA